jgi:hypothetical protein
MKYMPFDLKDIGTHSSLPEHCAGKTAANNYFLRSIYWYFAFKIWQDFPWEVCQERFPNILFFLTLLY